MYSSSELADFFASSATTYRFYAQLFFKELNEQAIDALARETYPCETGNESLDAGYALVRRYFAFPGTDRRTQLACEYARVFLAAGVYSKGKRTAVPYESVFTSEEHIVMQESRDDVVRRYWEEGFLVDPSLHEPEDHLSFELEFLSHINARCVQLCEDGEREALACAVERQISFIEDHVLNWIGDLYDTACDYAKLAFYTGMILVVKGTLEQNKAILEDVRAQLSGAAA